jgi:hypothetical protein
MTLSKKERDLMEHALGRDRSNKKRDYRNNYCSNPGDEDSGVWSSLVERGLAIKTMGPNDWQPYDVFAVTDAGKTALDEK